MSKSWGRLHQIFVAFSEKMNFNGNIVELGNTKFAPSERISIHYFSDGTCKKWRETYLFATMSYDHISSDHFT